MKVAILTSGFFPVVDGVSIAVFQRLRRLSQLGYQVLVLCPDYQPIADLYPDWAEYVGEIMPNVTVRSLPSAPFMGVASERNVQKNSYPALLQALTAFQPELIHVDEPERLQLGWDRIPAIDYARRASIPCVSFLHTNFIDYLEDYFSLPRIVIRLMQAISRRIVSRIYNAYDATLISSTITFEQASRMGIKNAIQGEFLGVDLAQFDPALRQPDFFARHYQLPELDTKLKLLFLGRLTPDKGWKFTIAALTAMARQPQYRSLFAQVGLIIAGAGDMQAEIDRALRQLPCPVRFLGRVPPPEVPALLLNSDLHLTASEKETRGLTLLEAMAAGIPVLAPRAGGIPDTVQPEQTGLLFQPGSVSDFASQLQRLVSQPELRQHLGATARQQAADLDWTDAIDRLIQSWQQIKSRDDSHERSV